MKRKNLTWSFLTASLILLSGCGGGGGSSDNTTTNPNNNAKLQISEVLADNNSTNQDPDLNLFSDWIELHNSSASSLDIGGYGLSDTSKKIKWQFPAGTTMSADSYLLVWADDFNETLHPNPTAFHANFKIKSNDETVTLFDKDGQIIDKVKLKDHKVTSTDISIARQADGTFALTQTPTPKQPNSTSTAMLSKKPSFSVKEGVYSSSFDVEITAENGADIYYTTDGTDATVNSNKYSAPITISANKTTLKAVAKEQGSDKLVSREKSVTYVVAPQHSVVINEVFADNNSSATEDYKKYDWVELYNSSNSEVTLTNYRLSDSKKLEKSNWKIPNGTKIAGNGYLIIWADDQNSTNSLHSDFKLNNSGDSVVLYNDNNQIIDFVDFKSLKDGKSLSRQGENNFTKTSPTPNHINNQ